MKVYRDNEVDLKLIRDKSIVVIGYGNQVRAFAQNMKDSGLNVAIALEEKSKSIRQAVDDGFPVISNDDTHRAEIILMLLPDHFHGDYYLRFLDGKLSKGQSLVFAHGYSIHFGFVKPPDGVNCLLIAPHGPGKDLRESYTDGTGISCFVATRLDRARKSLGIALAIAGTIGCTRVGAFRTTFEHEAVGDLFGEQALLCGGLSAMTIAAFDTLVKHGIPPENAYLETAHQLQLLANLIEEGGITGMMGRISKTAQFGTMTANETISDSHLERKFDRIMKDVLSGKFAREWENEHRSGGRRLRKFIRSLRSSGFEKTARKMKKLLSENK